MNPKKENKLIVVLLAILILTYAVGVLYDAYPDFVGKLLLLVLFVGPSSFLILFPLKLFFHWHDLDVLYWILSLPIIIAMFWASMIFFI